MTTRRRTKGEGSITKTTSGKYRVRLDCGYTDGKRKQMTATCATLSEARIKLRYFEEINSTTNVAASMNMTVQQLFQAYIDYKRKRDDVKETTIYNYECRLKFLPDYIKECTLNKINTTLIDKYIDDLKVKGLKETTIKTNITILGCIFNYAVQILRIIPSSPIRGCKKVMKVKIKPNIEILSEDEHKNIRAYLEKCYKERVNSKFIKPDSKTFLYIAYMLAYELGLREGEILGLRYSRINLNDKTIVIDNQLVRIGSKGSFNSTPKSAASIRLLVISDGLTNILREYKERFQYNESDDYLFSKDINGQNMLTNSTLLAIFKKTLKMVGITRHFTFHMIRHTNATRLIEKTNNDYKTVSERLGHSSVAITFNVYAHIIKKQHQLAATLMDCTK
ncbi:MAG: tyrosine-type recombinase/integrase [Phascolarctobacterium sp.]|uniref:tyrosine-type recombinase/integrase n=1 Tax=Phascolarctobacterium sp. TaxID=2049039 RepID=UPI0026DBEC08|nr:site-specific integrase [Phascolarctobacterium sp.]MDO4921776.1 tyrosine-type recombinase/integrase [Phascolarctobacterium sp.]